MATEPTEPKLPSHSTLLATVVAIGLGGVTLAVYWPALHHEFLAYDDQQYVTENPHVQAGLTWPAVVWAFRSFYASNWHPLTWLSHMLDCQIYGLTPWGHHLTNVLLHVANTLLLFLVLRRLTGCLWPSAAVAALFGWHPVHVESVAWVAERKDLLCALFWILTIGAYGGYARARTAASTWNEARSPSPPAPAGTLESGASRSTAIPRWQTGGFYGAALLCFALALLCKPMAVTLPLVLLLLDYWPLQRWQRRGYARLFAEKTPFLLLTIAACTLTLLAQRDSHSVVSVASLPMARRLPHALLAYAHYLGSTFFPIKLAVQYPYPIVTPLGPALGAAGLLVALSAVIGIIGLRRRYWMVGWLWFLGTLVPVIGLVQVGDQAWADRYTYLPLIGIFVAVAWGVRDLVLGPLPAGPPRPWARMALLGACGLLVGAVLLGLTSHQLRYWKNTRSLFAHSAAVTRNNNRAATVLGSLLQEEGKLEEAKQLYRQALSIRPEDPEAHFLLGTALEKEGKWAEAVGEFNQALWFKPLQERTHVFLGVILAKQKQYVEAATHYQTALTLNPESATAHNNLARLLHSQGHPTEAMEHYAAALRLNPRLASAHNNLGILQLQQGQREEGLVHLREAVRLKPADPESQFNLAVALNQLDQAKEALEIFTRLASSFPNDAKFHFEFGQALARRQRTREALSHYARALRLNPDYPEALDRLAWVLATDPHPELRNGVEAVPMAERACELTRRKNPTMLTTLAATYAETGRFAEALTTLQQARELASAAGRSPLSEKMPALLEAIRAEHPWHEPLSPSSP